MSTDGSNDQKVTPSPSASKKEMFKKMMDNNKSAHESNKREAFDGMRAYHMSEIYHKKDAIDILKTILQAELVLYTGLVASASQKVADSNSIMCVAWIAAIVFTISCLTITITTNMKISRDNDRYYKYSLEYMMEREIIGLTSDFKTAEFSSSWEPSKSLKDLSADSKTKGGNKKKEKSGFYYTKFIITSFSVSVILIAFIGVLVTFYSTKMTSSPTQSKPTHVVIDSVGRH